MANDLKKSEAWASVMQSQLEQAFVGKFIADTKFEGLFEGNKTVHFKRQAKIQYFDMATSYAEIPLSNITQVDETFTLSTRKGFAVAVSDEDYKEIDISPDSQIMRDAVEQAAKLYDTAIMQNYVNAGLTITDSALETASNGGGTNAIIASKTNIYDILTAVEEKLDTAPDSLGNPTGVPDSNRWVVFSPKEKRLLSKAPELLRSTDLGDKTVTGGFMGEINGLKIYWSNNLVTSGSKYALFGQGKPICFGALMKPKVEFVGSETQAQSFVNTMKSQTYYGTKVFSEGAERLGSIKLSS